MGTLANPVSELVSIGTCPVTLEEFKHSLRVTHSSDDTLLTGLLFAAWEHFCKQCQTGAPRQIKQYFSLPYWCDFYPRLLVPVIQLEGVEARLKESPTLWTSLPSALVQFFPYPTSAPVFKAWLEGPNLAADSAGKQLPNVRLTLSVGWASPEAVPKNVKVAVKLLAGHWYENPTDTSPDAGGEIPHGVAKIIELYRPRRA